VLDIALPDLDRLHRAGGGRRLEFARLGQRVDIAEARVAADRPAALAHEFHAVEVRRIVAGGYHDAAADTLIEGGEIDLLGAAQADVEHVGAARVEPLGERRGQRVAGQADVAADDHAARLDDLRVGATDPPGDVLVEFVGHPPAHVVGLETADLHAFLHGGRRRAL
jgi:hypothetical protein